MKFLSLALGLICLLSVDADNEYWQQKVKYDMEIDFDTSNHQFKGKQTKDTAERMTQRLPL